MTSTKKGGNTLCVVSFLIVLLGIGLYCVFKPPQFQEKKVSPPETHIRTPLEDSRTPFIPKGEAGLPVADDNIELINV